MFCHMLDSHAASHPCICGQSSRLPAIPSFPISIRASFVASIFQLHTALDIVSDYSHPISKSCYSLPRETNLRSCQAQGPLVLYIRTTPPWHRLLTTPPLGSFMVLIAPAWPVRTGTATWCTINYPVTNSMPSLRPWISSQPRY